VVSAKWVGDQGFGIFNLGYSGFPVKKYAELNVGTATKIRIISRKDAKSAKKQNKFPNLAFLAAWREEYPSPIKNLRFSHKFESR
jgi:hypothetical protein